MKYIFQKRVLTLSFHCDDNQAEIWSADLNRIYVKLNYCMAIILFKNFNYILPKIQTNLIKNLILL